MKSDPEIRFSRALLIIIIFIDMIALTNLLVKPGLMHHYFTEATMSEL